MPCLCVCQIYKDKIAADAVDEQAGNAPTSLFSFVLKWFDHKYGIANLAQAALSKLAGGVIHLRTESLYCDMVRAAATVASCLAECGSVLMCPLVRLLYGVGEMMAVL